MAPPQGRGAQVRLDPEHRALARGTGGSLVENLIAKRRFEERGLGPDGNSVDGSTWTGTEALDEVLAPGGLLTGAVPGGGTQTGILRGSVAFAASFTGSFAGFGADALRGFVNAVSSVPGATIRGLAPVLKGNAAAVSTIAGSIRGLSTFSGQVPINSTVTGTLVGAGPLSGTTAFKAQFGSGLFAFSTTVTAFSGTLRGIGAAVGTTAATSTFAGVRGGLGRIVGDVPATFALVGTASAIGAVVVTPDSVLDRSNAAVVGRDNQAIEGRPSQALGVQDRAGANISLRDGSLLELGVVVLEKILDRQGAVIVLRDGGNLEVRAGPDAPVEVPTDGFPVGPHLRIDNSSNTAAVILEQNGTTAKLRLVRPLFANTDYAAFPTFNTAQSAGDFYISQHYDRFVVVNNKLQLQRDLTSEDDGTYPMTVYRNLQDGTVLSLALEISVAVDASTVNPQPTPSGAGVFLETFAPGRGLGALTQSWNSQDIQNTPEGTILLTSGNCGCLTPNSVGVTGQHLNEDRFGFGNGRYEFRVRLFGSGDGPAVILWPADDIWPGSEVDLWERLADGRSYAALHRRNPSGGGDDYQGFIFQDNPALGNFDASQWHTVAADLFQSVFRFWVDGTKIAEITDPAWLPKDFLRGGVNHTVGVQNMNGNTRLECDWIRFTPEAQTSGGAYVDFGYVDPDFVTP